MKSYDIAHFEAALKKLKLYLTTRQLEQFMYYYELLIEWNRRMNLTAITDYEEILQKHFVDSLSVVKAMNLNRPLTLLDVGSGAGFPGLPIKIVYPGARITLLESQNKRVKFLNEVIRTLCLNGVEVINGRAEDYARDKEMREMFDMCVSRAVANLSTLSELCLPFVKIGGSFVAYKSEKASEELREAEHAIQILGGKVAKQEIFKLPYSDINRHLLVIEKIKETPEKYPRKAGTPSKEPL